MIRMLRRFLRRDRGSVIIEFALVVPLFFIMLSGIIAMSRAYTRLNVLNSSLREGARFGAAIAPANIGTATTQVRQRIRTFSTAYGFTLDTSAVSVTMGNDVVVSVTNYALFSGITSFWGMNGVQVTRSAIFRWEYAP